MMKRRSMDSNNKHALLLGMFHGSYSKKKLGQEFRDKIRCDAMVKRGYNVKTLDNKHDKEDLVKNHCYANFTSRKMIPSMEEKWGKSISFDQVILDYFFCPDSWAKERWNGLIQSILPEMAEKGLLSKGAQIWLPHIPSIRENIEHNKKKLNEYFEIAQEGRVMKNPLYAATETVEKELATVKPASLTNENQIEYMHQYSDNPFYLLTVKDKYASKPPIVVNVVSDESSDNDSADSVSVASSNSDYWPVETEITPVKKVGRSAAASTVVKSVKNNKHQQDSTSPKEIPKVVTKEEQPKMTPQQPKLQIPVSPVVKSTKNNRHYHDVTAKIFVNKKNEQLKLTSKLQNAVSSKPMSSLTPKNVLLSSSHNSKKRALELEICDKNMSSKNTSELKQSMCVTPTPVSKRPLASPIKITSILTVNTSTKIPPPFSSPRISQPKTMQRPTQATAVEVKQHIAMRQFSKRVTRNVSLTLASPAQSTRSNIVVSPVVIDNGRVTFKRARIH